MNAFSYGFKKFWWKRMPLAVLGYLCSTIAVISDLLIPFLGADIVNYYFVGTEVNDRFFGFLFENAANQTALELFSRLAIVFAVLVVVRIVFIYIKNVSLQWNGLDMENEMRRITYKKLMELDGQTLSAYNTGELLTVMNRDTVMSKEMYSRNMLNYYDSVVAIVIACIFLASINPWFLLIPVVVAPVYVVALVKYVRKIHKIFSEMRNLFSELNLAVQENIHAVRLVRSFSNEQLERKKFEKASFNLRNCYFEFDKTSAKYNSLFEFFMQTAYAITIAIGAFLVLGAYIDIGYLSAATAYVLRILKQISTISQTTGNMQRQYVSMQRLQKFMETESKIEDYGEAAIYSARPHIKVENVSLTLAEKQVLKNITLDIPFGKKVGVMGGTGSGKTVLLKSFARIFDVTSGEITVDGKNIKDMQLEDLRNEFAYVFQDVFLFSHTIDANIAFYNDKAEMSEVEEAAAVAQATNFIEKLDDGFQTVIGERGLGISGGQKQRISIARALMKNAPVLILDDASSALDMATEKRVLDGIKEKYPEHSMLIAAHRVSSVADCDEIIYMQDGEIVERGTLSELVALNGRFAAIYRLQTSDGQLDDSSYGASEIEKEGGTL